MSGLNLVQNLTHKSNKIFYLFLGCSFYFYKETVQFSCSITDKSGDGRLFQLEFYLWARWWEQQLLAGVLFSWQAGFVSWTCLFLILLHSSSLLGRNSKSIPVVLKSRQSCNALITSSVVCNKHIVPLQLLYRTSTSNIPVIMLLSCVIIQSSSPG